MEGFMTRYQGRNLWLCTIRTEFPRLFSELAAMELAKQAITQAQSVSSRCGALGLDGASGLARQARVELARIWRTTFVSADRKHSEPVALALLRCLVNDVLCEEPPNEVFAALDAAILSDASDQSPQFRTDLRDRILKWADLGDPRLSSNGPSWSKLSRPGRDRFLSWLAQDSLTFFFEKILPSHSAGAERGFFWMTYLGQIADFRVALSQIDEFRLSRMQGVSPPEFSKTEHRSTSAFVMRLKGKRPLVVVEFSELGHAAYLYFAEEFDRSVGSLHVKKLGISLLKNASAAGRIVHREGWEDTTVALLAQCGIRR
jgi:hypothetical protein